MNMQAGEYLQILVYFLAIVLPAPWLGIYLKSVFTDKKTVLSPIFLPVEKFLMRVFRLSGQDEMSWKEYAGALLVFNGLCLLVVTTLQMLQASLPLNPNHLENVSWHLAFNTAVSFVTNTNWQSYAGETTMSNLIQMGGLAVQNFASAATGLAVLVALIRAMTRFEGKTIGNYWSDLVKSTVHVFLPLSFILALVLVSQGVVQTFDSAVELKTVEGQTQTIPLGPAASQVAIKQLGTNGGGFFNANSAHPFENPTPLSGFLQMVAILMIPAATCFLFGFMVKAPKQGWSIFIIMLGLLFSGLVVAYGAELYSAKAFHPPMSLMEGKETRFGVVNSVLWAVATTAASNGSINAMMSSLSPLASGVALFNIMLGEIVFGGIGVGFVGMLFHVLLAVFLAGLMVGRTPEYLGKKLGVFDMKMVVLGILLPSITIMAFSGVSVLVPEAMASLTHKGSHGLTELIYNFSSAAGNNGSAFAGMNANVPYYNVMMGIAMLVGRFGVIVPALALAGSLVTKPRVAVSSGTLPTDTPLFALFLLACILITCALTFFPALCLGPVAEQLMLMGGTLFP